MTENIRKQLDLPDLNQVGFVVRDMEAALALYEPLFGPFSAMDPGPMTYDYRGEEEECEMRLAFGKSGDVEIELIQWVAGGCPHKEFLDAGRSGVHHVGLMPENFAETCNRYQALGFEAAFECSIAGTQLVYYDTVETLGHFTELWDRSESFIEFQRSVKEAARNWDGSDPVRRGAV